MSPSDSPHAHFGHEHRDAHGSVVSHWHHDADTRRIYEQSFKSILIAFLLNLGFSLVEIVGGLLTGSIAILSDAVHDMGDTISLATALYLLKVSGGGRDENYSYGYRRYSLLSAVIAGVFIIAASLWILSEVVTRLREPREVHGWGMFGLAVLGVTVNGIAALRLRGGESHTEKMLSWHLLEDAAGWVAVLLGSLSVVFFGWHWVDPVLALLIAVWVVFNVVRQLKRTLEVFLQKSPSSFPIKKVDKLIRDIPGVVGLHDMHAWSLDGLQNVLSLHLVLKDKTVDPAQVKREVQKIVSEFGSFHTTLETEIEGEHGCDNCDT